MLSQIHVHRGVGLCITESVGLCNWLVSGNMALEGTFCWHPIVRLLITCSILNASAVLYAVSLIGL